MVLNKQKGSMYEFVSHTWNPIRGECPHKCSYCYMKRFPVGKLRLDPKTLVDTLGSKNFIFVGSSTDMFAKEVPSEWITRVLKRCQAHPTNTYLFQTKNPKRFQEFQRLFPKNTILGTTIESNNARLFSNAPPPEERAQYMSLKYPLRKKMCTIEPIMDFDLAPLVKMIKSINPDWVNIGADSQRNNLSEPSKEKIEALITELEKFTEVKIKNNLKRINNPGVKDEL